MEFVRSECQLRKGAQQIEGGVELGCSGEGLEGGGQVGDVWLHARDDHLIEKCESSLPLAGPQTLWATLEAKGWGSWANISLCVSVPAATAPPALLAMLAQSLCDANDALRTSFIRPPTAGAPPTHQRVHPTFQLPVRIEHAPPTSPRRCRLRHRRIEHTLIGFDLRGTRAVSGASR